MTHELTGTSVRDPGGSQLPVYMASLQDGYEELGQEQLERLRQDISNIKSNYRRATVSRSYATSYHYRNSNSDLIVQ